ncbi:MAG: DNA cytosine methyltransferase, partial [Candidatus Micrarchaeia archaeon]
EQGSPYTLDYKGAIRPSELKDAFLRTLDRVEKGSLNPKSALEYLFAMLVRQRDKHTIVVSRPRGLSIEMIITFLDKHFYYKYKNEGASRLPVIAIYAAYTQMMNEVGRYKNWILSDLGRHNAADRRANTIGDIQVLDESGNIVEAVEIKYEKQIDTGIIMEAFKKFNTLRVERYYILTTYKSQQHNEEITEAITKIKNENGCQVIVNGVEPTLKYYLRLLKNPDTFIDAYAELLEKDPDIKYEQRKVWNQIVEEG